MRILQAGAAKSGNFWLYKIIDNIYVAAGLQKRSFVQNQPVYADAKHWKLSYPEQASIDMLDIENKQCYWRISSAVRKPVTDEDKYIDSTSHVWTHSRICGRSLKVYPKFDKVVYVIRDPRDRVLSEAKFAFSDYMQQYFPSGERSPEEYLQNNFIKSMDRWRWHVYDHLRYAGELNIHIVFYERLLKDFDQELYSLLNYLELDLPDDVRRRIKEEVDFSTMKKKNGDHLKKRHYGSWEDVLTPEQKKMAEEINRHLLHLMQYPNGRFIPGVLPQIPKDLSKEFMESHLDKVGRYCHKATTPQAMP
jgi:aryl sulfotransferase